MITGKDWYVYSSNSSRIDVYPPQTGNCYFSSKTGLSFIRVSTSCFSNVNLLICSQQAAIAEESSQAFQRISVVGHPNTLRNVTTSLPKKEVNGGDAIIVGVLSIDVVHTPGHTDGSLSLLHSPTRYVLEFVACCSEPNT